MKTLYLILGVSGSGKTTFAKELSAALEYCYELCADYYFCKSLGDFTYDEDSYNYDGSKIILAHEWCYKTVRSFMQEKDKPDVVVHNTFTQNWEMQRYVDLACKFDYKVVRLVVENTHGKKDVHNVPQEVRDRQERNLRNNLKLQ